MTFLDIMGHFCAIMYVPSCSSEWGLFWYFDARYLTIFQTLQAISRGRFVCDVHYNHSSVCY
ncbi:MAG: hypothetical protein UV60_C0044G0003 [Parcubacteria group bacterium GW2011_GWA2_43_11]|nr:MAG: hypothetical protein UV60_C0044G0003 [Parcubacteria group bacterium GW2011_GWA2_43_11]KKW14284.1 MAG: hypothetical protein UY52_C0031G0005 [Parcubacteria group bacterium GW2011_GWC2_49_9]